MYLLWSWGIVNFFVGLYEVYCFANVTRLHLHLPIITQHTISGQNIWQQAWTQYCLADPRYVLPDSQYVWMFELVNAGLAAVFLAALVWRASLRFLKLVLLLQLYGCVLYFLTFLDDDLAQRASTRLIDPFWRSVYFGMSSLWIIVPLSLCLFVGEN